MITPSSPIAMVMLPPTPLEHVGAMTEIERLHHDLGKVWSGRRRGLLLGDGWSRKADDGGGHQAGAEFGHCFSLSDEAGRESDCWTDNKFDIAFIPRKISHTSSSPAAGYGGAHRPIRFWHKADIGTHSANVRFWG
jgi:hypothetical protein